MLFRSGGSRPPKSGRGPSISAVPQETAAAPQDSTSAGSRQRRKKRKGGSTAPSIRQVTDVDIQEIFADFDRNEGDSAAAPAAAEGGPSKRSRSRRKKNKGGAGAPPVSGGDAGANEGGSTPEA